MLLIALVNVVMLLLARKAQRQKAFLLLLAVGVGREQMVRMILKGSL